MKTQMLELLKQNGYITVSKVLARTIGLHETTIFSELLSLYFYKNLEWFYATSDYLKKQTTLSNYYQTKAIDHLKKIGFIDCKRKGVPARRWFKITIDDEGLFQFLKGLKTCIKTVSKQELKPVENYSYNNNTNNNKINIPDSIRVKPYKRRSTPLEDY